MDCSSRGDVIYMIRPQLLLRRDVLGAGRAWLSLKGQTSVTFIKSLSALYRYFIPMVLEFRILQMFI